MRIIDRQGDVMPRPAGRPQGPDLVGPRGCRRQGGRTARVAMIRAKAKTAQARNDAKWLLVKFPRMDCGSIDCDSISRSQGGGFSSASLAVLNGPLLPAQRTPLEGLIR
jgi:hypothetical protein